MSDDLDDLLRRSMKTLDDQVPSGYFDGLPTRTLARLEDSSMQTTGTSSSSDSTGPIAPPAPIPPKDRDEDSGLHDIRSLASSTKLRLSSRRSTQNPIVHEDDVLASSSAGWKAVALPEPAKMVSLPELADLPSKAEVEALDKAAQKKAKADAKAAKAAASAPAEKIAFVAKPVTTIPTETPAETAAAAPMIGSRIAAQKASGGRGKMIALVGFGLSAAAAATFFFVINNKSESKSELSYESKASAPLPEMTAKQLPAPAPAAAIEATPTAGAAIAAAEPPPPAEPVADKAAATKAEKPGKVHKVEIRDTVNKDPKPTDKPIVAPKEEIKAKGGDDGEPSFDALLKEAGVDGQKKKEAPKLDKKSLSGGDIKTGMGSVAGKAAKCYAGTQGTAGVKLTVSPSGQVSKVTVTGVFAGTPVAACVESAVKSASFPAWDGGPQSFGYSYLLSE